MWAAFSQHNVPVAQIHKASIVPLFCKPTIITGLLSTAGIILLAFPSAPLPAGAPPPCILSGSGGGTKGGGSRLRSTLMPWRS